MAGREEDENYGAEPGKMRKESQRRREPLLGRESSGPRGAHRKKTAVEDAGRVIRGGMCQKGVLGRFGGRPE